MEDTRSTYNVYPFKEGYEAAKNIPIGTCATLVEGEGGSNFIVIGHKMLYFGNKMKRSLLNQNQIRDFINHWDGGVQDNYTWSGEPFGLTTKDAFIPFEMDRSAVLFPPRVPSQYKMENLLHVVLTLNGTWDPHRLPLWIARIRHTGMQT